MRLYRANEDAGVEGFCKGNYNNPESQDPEEKVWGKMKIPLCSLTDTKTTLDKGLKDRQIRMGFSSSYLRKQLSPGNWGKWILKSREFAESHWHASTDFDQIVKMRVENSKQAKLAGRNKNVLIIMINYSNLIVKIGKATFIWQKFSHAFLNVFFLAF